MSLKTYKHIAVDPEDYDIFCKLGTVKDTHQTVFKRILNKAGAV